MKTHRKKHIHSYKDIHVYIDLWSIHIYGRFYMCVYMDTYTDLYHTYVYTYTHRLRNYLNLPNHKIIILVNFLLFLFCFLFSSFFFKLFLSALCSFSLSFLSYLLIPIPDLPFSPLHHYISFLPILSQPIFSYHLLLSQLSLASPFLTSFSSFFLLSILVFTEWDIYFCDFVGLSHISYMLSNNIKLHTSLGKFKIIYALLQMIIFIL